MKRTLAPSLALVTALTLSACSGLTGQSAQEGTTFNNADVMFARMMIPHHEQAIEMSDVILGKEDVDSEITDLATQIKAAQGPEIEQLTTWLDDWGAHGPQGSMDHGSMGDDAMGDGPMGGSSMGGMMSEDDMEALENAEGADAERLFLEQMVVHHEGAIEMAQAEVEHGSNEDVVELAGSIIDSQTSEIQTMEDLLAAM